MCPLAVGAGNNHEEPSRLRSRALMMESTRGVIGILRTAFSVFPQGISRFPCCTFTGFSLKHSSGRSEQSTKMIATSCSSGAASAILTCRLGILPHPTLDIVWFREDVGRMTCLRHLDDYRFLEIKNVFVTKHVHRSRALG